jgi:hypothetical protein
LTYTQDSDVRTAKDSKSRKAGTRPGPRHSTWDLTAGTGQIGQVVMSMETGEHGKDSQDRTAGIEQQESAVEKGQLRPGNGGRTDMTGQPGQESRNRTS